MKRNSGPKIGEYGRKIDCCISLSKEVARMASARAASFGVTRSFYIEWLILQAEQPGAIIDDPESIEDQESAI